MIKYHEQQTEKWITIIIWVCRRFSKSLEVFKLGQWFVLNLPKKWLNVQFLMKKWFWSHKHWRIKNWRIKIILISIGLKISKVVLEKWFGYIFSNIHCQILLDKFYQRRGKRGRPEVVFGSKWKFNFGAI